MHHALKRQAENRQHSVLQGLTFIHSYYMKRKLATSVEERQEAHFNVARCYHLLGLVQLAIPYYWKVFSEVSNNCPGNQHENVILDTAYNLQSIYLLAGNNKLAKEIVKQWLEI